MGEVAAHNLEFWASKVTNDPDLLAEDVYGRKIPLDAVPKPKPYRTFCNVQVQRICTALDVDCFDAMTANQIYEYCLKNWQPVDAEAAVAYAAIGDAVLAAWKNPDPEKHGHVAVVLGRRPLPFSGKWSRSVPWVASVDCEYPVGANFAFANLPDYFRAGKVNA